MHTLVAYLWDAPFFAAAAGLLAYARSIPTGTPAVEAEGQAA